TAGGGRLDPVGGLSTASVEEGLRPAMTDSARERAWSDFVLLSKQDPGVAPAVLESWVRSRDVVGDLPSDTQLALLHVLQEREFERVGGTRSIKVDVRVIAATNRDLNAAMATGAFRSDLFYRLNVFPIEMPALRERPEDIPLLGAYFVDRYARKAGKTIGNIDQRTLEMLQGYSWAGNIRELQNVIERSVVICETETFAIDESWLHRELPKPPHPVQSLADDLVGREKEMIETALAASRGRVSGPSGAAAKLGIPGSTLDSKNRGLGIRKERFKGV